jgi:hypothetical protein
MGLLQKLVSGTGSPLSKGNGIQPPTPIGATPSSKLQNGYFTHYQVKPTPSELDAADGQTPSSPLTQNSTKPHLGQGFKNGTYKNSAPPEGVGRI